MNNPQQLDNPGTLAVFDTGMGGLSLIAAIHRRHPQKNLCFITDNERFPYGNQTPDVATKWLLQVATFLAQRGVKKLLLGCNTVTAMTESGLQGLDTPLEIEGPIRATVEAITAHLRNTLVLLFATEATIKTGVYQQLLDERNIPFIPINGGGLERVIENEHPESNLVKQRVHAIVQEMMARIPEELRNNDIAVVLGCTHFVLIEGLLENIFMEKGLSWKTFNPLPLIVDALTDEQPGTTMQPGGLHILHTAAYSDQWWESCSRFIPEDLKPNTTREFISLT